MRFHIGIILTILLAIFATSLEAAQGGSDKHCNGDKGGKHSHGDKGNDKGNGSKHCNTDGKHSGGSRDHYPNGEHKRANCPRARDVNWNRDIHGNLCHYRPTTHSCLSNNLVCATNKGNGWRCHPPVVCPPPVVVVPPPVVVVPPPVVCPPPVVVVPPPVVVVPPPVVVVPPPVVVVPSQAPHSSGGGGGFEDYLNKNPRGVKGMR